jgi:anhydro-N-acetylmuramic acid kinase
VVPFSRAIGLMSGTSFDGVDIALVDTDGERLRGLGPTGYRPYTQAERALLRDALRAAETLADRTARPGVLADAERLVTDAHAEAVAAFLSAHALAARDIDVVGFHGQTVLHRPAQRLTVQIGDGRALAARLAIPVVYDFRAADVAAGGQGAPFVPIFHHALAATIDRPRPLVVVNIGGVANITYLADGAAPLACDTGPGNALIDDFLRARSGPAFDDGGMIAARGKADEAFLALALAHPFFAAPLPKSLDRNDFALASIALPELSLEDGAATLAALTARSIAAIMPHLPNTPAYWIVAGGGARNRTILRMLGEAVAPARVETADALGWSADALEAQAFAYLAVRTLKGLPITFPTTTGVSRPMTGGVLVGADRSG